MKHLFCLLCALFPLSAAAQTGAPALVDLGSGAHTLNLAASDYALILHSALVNEPDTARTFAYTATPAGAAKRAHAHVHPFAPTERDRFENILRDKERELARRLKASGGWKPSAPKFVQQSATRTFVFEAFGGVTADRTLTATLVASTPRAVAYVDNALPASEKNITPAQITALLDRFSTFIHPLVTDMFGQPSDVDDDGKVLFLFTHLVDQVGGVAGFYSSGSLFSTAQGGDGNLADMMFISPTQSLVSYEALLAHEFQHLVNFYQHVMLRSGDAEASWLNEGLSHVTEDMVGGHIDGGNPDLINAYMTAPERYALTGPAQLNSGVRGAAYLFVRGLMEEFGSDVPGRLVKTDKAGIENVEALSGRNFESLFQTHLARLYLSGTALNSDPALNYEFPYFTEPATRHRSLPMPREHRLGQQAVSGAVKPAAAAFLRLSGPQTIQIQADPAGRFRGILIPLPQNFQPQLSLPVNYFQGLRLDAPMPATFEAGESIAFSGAVEDPAIEQVLLSFEPRNGAADEEITFSATVSGGRFRETILFAPSQAGEYKLNVYAGQAGALLPHIGGFLTITVTPGSGPVHLPIDFFTSIVMDAPLPAQFTAGTGVSFAGRVSNATIDVLILVFTSRTTGEEIRVQMQVENGAFRKGFVFTPGQAGAYDLDLFGGASGGSLPHLGGFSPIHVTATGGEKVSLPVDYFDDIVLDTPLETTFLTGQSRSVSGLVNAGITQVAISFAPLSGGADIDAFINVNNGRFATDIAFSDAQIGQYELKIFGGQRGQSLPFLGAFSPVFVRVAETAPRTPDFDGDGIVGFSDFLLFAGAFGKTSSTPGFDTRFDLDGDSAIGFSDFLVFAAAFGKPA